MEWQLPNHTCSYKHEVLDVFQQAVIALTDTLPECQPDNGLGQTGTRNTIKPSRACLTVREHLIFYVKK